ncbi:unnamed protein product, partial [Mesorhabditis spiculigera]
MGRIAAPFHKKGFGWNPSLDKLQEPKIEICESFTKIIETDENADRVRVVEILRTRACNDDHDPLTHWLFRSLDSGYQKLHDCWRALEAERNPWPRASGNCDEITREYASRVKRDAKKCGYGEADQGFLARLTQLKVHENVIGNGNAPAAVQNCRQEIVEALARLDPIKQENGL